MSCMQSLSGFFFFFDTTLKTWSGQDTRPCSVLHYHGKWKYCIYSILPCSKFQMQVQACLALANGRESRHWCKKSNSPLRRKKVMGAASLFNFIDKIYWFLRWLWKLCLIIRNRISFFWSFQTRKIRSLMFELRKFYIMNQIFLPEFWKMCLPVLLW